MRQRAAAVLLGALMALSGCYGSNTDPLPNLGGVSTVERLGSERANTFTANDQQRPSVAVNAAGDAVVVWESFGQDGSHFGIFGQRYRNGQRVGPEFAVNTFTTGRQSFPAVGMDGAGNFVVVWRSSLQDGPGGTIFGRRFLADGTPAGGEFQVGPGDSDFDSQSEPRVAMNAQGAFVVTWSNREITQLALLLGRNDLEQREIQARRYGPGGQPLGGAFSVTGPVTDGIVRAPDIGIAEDGRFVVSWIATGAQRGVFARRYLANGLPAGEAFPVHLGRDFEAVDFPALAVAPDGAFAASWEAFTFGYQPLGIFTRRFDADGTALGALQRVPDPGGLLAERSRIASDGRGGYWVIAQSQDRIAVGGSGADDRPLLPRLISANDIASSFASLAVSPAGTAVAAWTTFGEDGDGRGVFVGHFRIR